MTEAPARPLADYPALPDLTFARAPRTGLAAGHDAFLLARAAGPLRQGMRVLELGSGQGAVALMLAAREMIDAVGLEIEAAPLAVAAKNLTRNRSALRGTVAFVRGDLRRNPLAANVFDLVVMNPPYWPVGSGRLPVDPARAAARFETQGDLHDWVRAGAGSLRPGGSLWAVVRPERGGAAAAALRAAGLESVNATFVTPSSGRTARWALLEARTGDGAAQQRAY